MARDLIDEYNKSTFEIRIGSLVRIVNSDKAPLVSFFRQYVGTKGKVIEIDKSYYVLDISRTEPTIHWARIHLELIR